MNMLNLGCGGHVHPAWTNLDLTARAPGVIAHDLRQGLPFPDRSFDCIYCSHVLEHLPKRAAPLFLSHCLRVLEPGGVIRLVVPDLEAIARFYLENLERALGGDREARERYGWIMIELLDQMTRQRSGGEMAAYWCQAPMPAEGFVRQRSGAELAGFLEQWRDAGRLHPAAEWNGLDISDEERLRFEKSGERHLWMYDRFSLAELLMNAGFRDPRPLGASESAIPAFAGYCLDTQPDGTTRKPDSLFMEAVKPLGGAGCAV